MPYCRIEQFIDTRPKIDRYMDIPVVTLDQARLNKDSLIVIVPMYDLDDIVESIKDMYGYISNEQIISFDNFVDEGKIIDEKF